MQRLKLAAVDAAMRKDDTTGEYAISNVDARVGLRAEALPMDSDAFAGFYQRSAPALRAYLARVSGNAALADDLAQESYLRFLCATQPEGGEVNYRRYLFRIATNLLRDHWRRPVCPHGRCHRSTRWSVGCAGVHRGRYRLRICGTLLRRVRINDSGRRQRLYLFLCDHG